MTETDATVAPAAPVMRVRDLVVEFPGRHGDLAVVDGVSFDVHRGEVLGIVGESGSGKSTLALTLVGLVEEIGAVVRGGSVMCAGQDLMRLSSRARAKLRGGVVSLVFQNPMGSFNPVWTVGDQLVEAITAHAPKTPRAQARARAVELLDRVGVPNPEGALDQLPGQFSGGMLQRAMIAIAVANNPRLIIADEPTTALDVTIQKEVLDLFTEIVRAEDIALILVTHDLGVVAEIADRLLVLYAGRIVELGDVHGMFDSPRHPYTGALLTSRPSVESGLKGTRLTVIPGTPPAAEKRPTGCAFHPRCPVRGGRERCVEEVPELEEVASGRLAACHFAAGLTEAGATGRRASVVPEVEPLRPEPPAPTESVLTVEGVVVEYGPRGRSRSAVAAKTAVDDVSLTLGRGETLALVGESGSGKSTLAKAIMGVGPALSAGRVLFGGRELSSLSRAERRRRCGELQLVFQSPGGSLNPRMRVRQCIAEPMAVHGVSREEVEVRVAELLDAVGLTAAHGNRYPREMSGGQQQRVGIARALALRPSVLVLDEPLSALDVSVQAQIVNLLLDLQASMGLAYLFISHDLAVVASLAHRIAVMYQGRVVETGPAHRLLTEPQSEYTRGLLSAVPIAEPQQRTPRTGGVATR